MAGEEKRGEERGGEEKEGNGNAEESPWGRSFRAKSTRSYTVPATARYADSPCMESGTHLFSIFYLFYFFLFLPVTVAQIEIILFPSLGPLFNNPSHSPSTSSQMDGFCFCNVAHRHVYLCPSSYLSFPFCLHEPYCNRTRLFPHVFLIIYTFSISRLFFSQLFRSVRRGFHLTSLIHLYARRCTGISLNASPIIPYPFSSKLDPAKISPER
jgi:hypothetical protein